MYSNSNLKKSYPFQKSSFRKTNFNRVNRNFQNNRLNSNTINSNLNENEFYNSKYEYSSQIQPTSCLILSIEESDLRFEGNIQVLFFLFLVSRMSSSNLDPHHLNSIPIISEEDQLLISLYGSNLSVHMYKNYIQKLIERIKLENVNYENLIDFSKEFGISNIKSIDNRGMEEIIINASYFYVS